MIKPVFSFESEVDSDNSSETSSVASSSVKGRRPSAYLPVAPATVERKASTDTNTVTIINTFINKSMITSEGELIRQQGINLLVALDRHHAIEAIAYQRHFEVSFRVGRHVMHMAFVFDLQHVRG